MLGGLNGEGVLMVAVYGGKLLDNPLLDVSSKTDLHVDGFGLDVGQEAFRLGCSLFLSLSLSLSLSNYLSISTSHIVSLLDVLLVGTERRAGSGAGWKPWDLSTVTVAVCSPSCLQVWGGGYPDTCRPSHRNPVLTLQHKRSRPRLSW